MQIKEFDRATVQNLMAELDAVLAQALAPYGLAIDKKRGTYDRERFTYKVEMIAAGADPGRSEFERYAVLLGVKPEDYGREFTSNGERYRLIGLNLNRPKFPFSAERLGGRGGKYKFPRDAVKRALGYAEGAQ
jgi:hypothetical protein